MATVLRAFNGAVSQGTTQTFAETSGGPQAGDVRYLFVNCSSSASITLPSGWTSLFNGPVGSGTLAVGSKAWVAGEGTQTITFSTTTQNGAEVVAVGGVDTGTAPVVATNGSTTAGTTLTTASVTPPTAGGLLLTYFAATTSTGGTTATLSNPAGLVDGEQHPGIAAGSYVIRISSLGLSSAAATGTFSSTCSVSASSYRTAALVVPAAAAGPLGPANFLPYLGLGTGVSR